MSRRKKNSADEVNRVTGYINLVSAIINLITMLLVLWKA